MAYAQVGKEVLDVRQNERREFTRVGDAVGTASGSRES